MLHTEGLREIDTYSSYTLIHIVMHYMYLYNRTKMELKIQHSEKIHKHR